jgi:cytochrome c oxidase assembly factor CtaG
LALAAGLYAAGVLKLRRRGEAWPARRSAAWALGLLVFAWVTVGGLGLYSHVLFSAHLVAQMLLSMIAPIGLVLGAPITLALRALPGPRVRGEASPRGLLTAALESSALRVLTYPLVAFALLVGSLFALYFTDLFPTLMGNHLGHVGMEFFFLAVGSLFFWVLLAVDSTPRRLSPIGQCGLLLAAMAGVGLFSAALMGRSDVLAPVYYRRLDRPYRTGLFSDQQFGAGVGWALGEIGLLLVLAAVLVWWSRQDDHAARPVDRAADRATSRVGTRET